MVTRSVKPGTLADPSLLAARIELLASAHVIPLEQWRRDVMEPDMRMPHFDPLDGGVKAGILILLETPGPGNAPIRFASTDNPSGTAANLRRFLKQAGLKRHQWLLWNAVPWIIHAPGARNRGVEHTEIQQGISLLPGLLERLPDLRVVILAGKVAAKAEPVVRTVKPAAEVFTMPHPSPTYVNTRPEIAGQIQSVLCEAGRHYTEVVMGGTGEAGPCLAEES